MSQVFHIPGLVHVMSSGYQPFEWINDNFTKSKYRSSQGFIIRYNNKSYIIVAREAMVYSNKLTSYILAHKSNGDITYIPAEVDILYQSVEYNIAILVSLGENYFDIKNNLSNVNLPNECIDNMGYIIDTRIIDDYKNHSIKVITNNFETACSNIIPKSKYFLDLDSYIPVQLFKCSFSIRSDIIGYCGCAVIAPNGLLSGIVIRSDKLSGDVDIISSIVLKSIIGNMLAAIDGLCDISGSIYSHVAHIPFEYRVIDNKMTVTKSIRCVSKDNEIRFTSGDIITEIDNKPIIVHDNKCMIYDKDIHTNVIIDCYVPAKYSSNSMVCFRVTRKSKEFDITCYPMFIPNVNNSMVSNFKPSNRVQFANIGKLIFIQLSHELLDFMYSLNIHIADDIIKQEINKAYVMILDCLDSKLNIPRLPSIYSQNNMSSNDMPIHCPRLILSSITIDDKVIKIDNLNNLINLISSNITIRLNFKKNQICKSISIKS